MLMISLGLSEARLTRLAVCAGRGDCGCAGVEARANPAGRACGNGTEAGCDGCRALSASEFAAARAATRVDCGTLGGLDTSSVSCSSSLAFLPNSLARRLPAGVSLMPTLRAAASERVEGFEPRFSR